VSKDKVSESRRACGPGSMRGVAKAFPYARQSAEIPGYSS
jgi:hypothetical protein